MSDDECKIGKQLELVHKWIHKCTRILNEDEIEQGDQLGRALMDLLNDGAGEGKSNGVKILAMYDCLISGIEHMEEFEPASEKLADQTSIN